MPPFLLSSSLFHRVQKLPRPINKCVLGKISTVPGLIPIHMVLCKPGVAFLLRACHKKDLFFCLHDITDKLETVMSPFKIATAITKVYFALICTLSYLVFSTASAQAGGLWVFEQGTPDLGTAAAGRAAMANDDDAV